MAKDAKELALKIAEWCSQNGQGESRFLTPEPQHFVYTFPLLDFIVEVSGISREELGEAFNSAQEERK